MAFDLATAQDIDAPVAPPARKAKFDLATARDIEPAPVEPAKPKPVTAGDRAMAVPSGLNAGIASLLGLPVDTAANVIDLVKAGIGYTQSKVTGKPHSEALDLDDRSQVPLSAEWISNKLNKVGIATEAPRPDDAASRFIHAAASGVPGAMTGGGGAANVTRQLVGGVASGLASQTAAELGADPGTQAATALAVGAGASAARVPKSAPKAPAKQPAATKPVEVARAAGYVLKPSEVGGKGGSIAEGLSGSSKLERSAVIKNQEVTNRLAAEELGLPADTKRITANVLKQAKAPHNAVYEELGNTVGDFQTTPEFGADLAKAMPTRGATRQAKEAITDLIDEHNLQSMKAKDAIQMTRQLRASSAKMIRSDNPDVETRGYAARAISDAIEQELERQAIGIGQADLVDRFRNARTALAKIHTVESARVGSDVSAKNLVKMASKSPNKLSGRLKLIADVASEFPNVTRTASTLKDTGPVNMWETATGIGGTVATGNPAFMAAMVARPATRSILLSDAYQNQFGKVAPQLGPDSPLAEYFTQPQSRPRTQPVAAQAVAEPLALPSPAMLADSQGNVGTAYARESVGLTPDVMAAASRHPGRAQEVTLGELLAPEPLRLPAPGQRPIVVSPEGVAGTAADHVALAKELADIGLTPDVIAAAVRHPGAGRIAADGPSRAPLALPAPKPQAMAVDPSGRVASNAGELSAYKEDMGLNGLRNVRQPDVGDAPASNAGATGAIEFTGDELGGIDQPLYELKSKARKHARENFADKTVNNEIDGTEIRMPWQSIKHSMAGKVSRAAAVALSRLDEVLTKAVPAGKVPDNKSRKDILGAYYYDTDISLAGDPVTIRAVVREHKDGHRYYDHFELLGPKKENPAPGGARPVQEVSGVLAERKDALSEPKSTITTGRGEHIELRGRDIKRRAAPVEHVRQGQD